MTKSITKNAYAKINLTLDVLSKRSDGYHEVKMIMQSISLHDTVSVKLNKSGIIIRTNLPYIPCDNRNIAYKAAAAFFDAAGIKDGSADIKIRKRIPVAAGLAGGSTDGAAVLKALNEIYKFPLTPDELLAVGATVGADVPFCMTGGTALCEGIGEKISTLKDIPDCFILLVKPPISISTADIYNKVDKNIINERPDTDGIMQCIVNDNIKCIARRVYNVMEPVTSAENSIIPDIKKEMIELSSEGAAMSGSGPTVFGIYTDKEKANKALKHFSGVFKEVFLCHPVHLF